MHTHHHRDGVEEVQACTEILACMSFSGKGLRTNDAAGALLALLAGCADALGDGRRGDFGDADGARVGCDNGVGPQLACEGAEYLLFQL